MNAAATFRLSTRDLPEHQRVATWRDLYGREVLRLDTDVSPDIAFHSDITMNLLPGLGIISGSISPCRLNRTKQLISDGNDNLFLIAPSGPALAYQRGRETDIGPGDAIFLSSGEVGGVQFSSSNTDLFAISLPAAALRPQLRDPDCMMLLRVSRAKEALRLLARYVAAAADVTTMESSDLRRAFVDHVYDLVALAVGATRDTAALANSRGLAAGRLRAIKDDIRANLHRPGLSVSKVAERHRVTTRYVQLLFEAEGTSFSRFVRDQRLESVHRMLSSPRHCAMSISAIAYETGFGDLSNFNHAFRRAYGATPSDVRAAARRDNGGTHA